MVVGAGGGRGRRGRTATEERREADRRPRRQQKARRPKRRDHHALRVDAPAPLGRQARAAAWEIGAHGPRLPLIFGASSFLKCAARDASSFG